MILNRSAIRNVVRKQFLGLLADMHWRRWISSVFRNPLTVFLGKEVSLYTPCTKKKSFNQINLVFSRSKTVPVGINIVRACRKSTVLLLNLNVEKWKTFTRLFFNIIFGCKLFKKSKNRFTFINITSIER